MLPKCSHYDKLGHTSDVCYSKFGYPPEHSKYPGRPCLFNNKSASGGGTTSSGGGAVNNVEVATLTHGGENKKESSAQGYEFHITMAQYQQLMNLLSKSSRPGGASSETTLTRANLTHSSSNQFHNSGFGSHFVFSISTTHTHLTLLVHTPHHG